MEKAAAPTYVVRVWGPMADPAPLGLAAFGLTTFMLSIHKAGWAPPIVWTTLAIYYGGASQFIAGMLSFARNDVFSATAFSTYGAFWLARAIFFLLYAYPGAQFYYPNSESEIMNALGWFTTGFFIFNCYMTVCALQTCVAVFVVFALLGITELFVFIGEFMGQYDGQPGSWTMAAGYMGFFTSVAAFYTSFAFCWNALAGRVMMPVGPPVLNMRKILADKAAAGGAPASSYAPVVTEGAPAEAIATES